jgi:GT2 family glycosyltransferase
MTTSKIVQYQARDKMNTSGTHLHFTGLGFSRGKNKHPTKYPCRETVPGVSGCSFAMSRAVYDEIGGFDELMEFYHEDVDISWRALLAGYQIVYTPESVVYHKYDRDLPSWRFYNYERNRLMIIIKYLKVRTVLCILLAILLTEVVMLGVSLRGLNYFLSKFRVWIWIWKHRKELGIKRRKAQELRQRSDGELLSQFEITIPLDQFGVPVVVHTITNLLLAIVYWPCYQLATRQC